MRRCEGKRRMWRGNRLGNYKCGRKAKFVFETYVGLSRSHYVCGDEECVRSITDGYGANNFRALKTEKV